MPSFANELLEVTSWVMLGLGRLTEMVGVFRFA